MTNDTKRAAKIVRGLSRRVDRLEQAISTGEGLPNPLRFVTDRSTATDDATVRTEAAGTMQWNQDSWDAARWQ